MNVLFPPAIFRLFSFSFNFSNFYYNGPISDFVSTLLTRGRVPWLCFVCVSSVLETSLGVFLQTLIMSWNTALISLPLFWEFHYTYVFTVAHMSFRHFPVFLMFSYLHYSIKHFLVTSIHHFSLLLCLMCSVKHLLQFLASGVFFFPPPVLEFQFDF